MPEFVLGMNAKAFQGAEDAALAALTEIDTAKDVTVSVAADEADVTTRGNAGLRQKAATLREITAEFQLQWKPGDAVCEAIRSAALPAGALLSMAFLTGARSVEHSEGPYGNWSITGFSRGEPLEEGVTIDITAKLTDSYAWIEDGVEA